MGTRKISQLDTIADSNLSGEAILPVVVSDPLIPNRKAKINQLFKGVAQGTKTAPGLCFDLDRDTGLYQNAYNEIGVGFGDGGVYFSRIVNSSEFVSLYMTAIDSTADNADIVLAPKGTGSVKVTGSFLMGDQNFILEDLSNMDNPEFLLNRQMNARSIDRVEAGTATAQDIQNVAKEFRTIMAMRDPEDRDSFQKSFIEQAAQQTGYSKEQLERAFDPASDPVVQQARLIAKGYAEEQAKAQEALAADQEKAAKIMTDGVVDSAINFRRTIIDAAKTAAAELRGASENAMFTANEMGSGFTAGILENSTSEGSMATIRAGLAAQGTGGPGDGAVSFDTSAMRDLITGAIPGMDTVSNAQLSALINSGTVTTEETDEDGNRLDLKKILATQGADAVRSILGNRENESMISVDPDLLSKVIQDNKLSFDQSQLALLAENGIIRFDFEGMKELQDNNLIKIDGEGLDRLENILSRYQTFTENNGGGEAGGLATGGVVYASRGSIIGMKPKGTETVPAMLTPGEFVINKKATSKNL